VVDFETRLKTVQARVQYSEADLRVCNEKISHLQQQKNLKESSLKELSAEIATLKKEAARLESRLKQLQQHTREVRTYLLVCNLKLQS
jgi:chromosome segregation ATPase